jgi:hypothetical protein
MAMNRRIFFSALTASLPLRIASAQQPALPTLSSLIDTPAALDRVILEMDALWSIMALNETRKSGRPPSQQERATYFNLRAQIASPQRDQLVAALRSPEAMARAAQAANAAEPTLARLRSVLEEIGVRSGSPLLNQLVDGFAIFNQLLVARSPQNARWWCNIYGLALLC